MNHNDFNKLYPRRTGLLTPRNMEKAGYAGLTVLTILTVLPIIAVVIYILVQGAPAISPSFIFDMPRDGMRAGGIWPAIVGTIYLTVGTAIFSVPLGIGADLPAEYAPTTGSPDDPHRHYQPGHPRWSRAVPAWGCSCFLKFGSASWRPRPLSILTLPVIISTTEEALRAVPHAWVVSISLGATRWETIRRIVLPRRCRDRRGVIAVWSGCRHRAHLFTARPSSCRGCPNPLDPTMALPPVRDLHPGAGHAVQIQYARCWCWCYCWA